MFDDVEIVRARYAPDRDERLAYRGGLLATVRDSAALPLVPGLVASLATATRKVAARDRPDVDPRPLVAAVGPGRARGEGAAARRHAARQRRRARSRSRAVAPLGRVVASRASRVRRRRLRAAARGGTCVLLRLDAARSGVVRMPIVVDARPPPLAAIPARPPVAAGRGRSGVAREGLRRAAGGAGAIARAAGARRHASRSSAAGPSAVALVAPAAIASGLGDAVAFVDPLPRARRCTSASRPRTPSSFPSRREGLGLVAVEALALGRPVIASRTGGLPEVVTPGQRACSSLLTTPTRSPPRCASLPLPAPPDPAPAVARCTILRRSSLRTARCTTRAIALLRSGLDLGVGLRAPARRDRRAARSRRPGTPRTGSATCSSRPGSPCRRGRRRACRRRAP